MVAREELADPAEVDDIALDVRQECEKYGRVTSVKIPRGGPYATKVLVEFSDVAGAVAAQKVLHGRSFSSKSVIADFMNHIMFAAVVQNMQSTGV